MPECPGMVYSICMHEFLIGKNDAGQRLDRFLRKAVPQLPSSMIQKSIRMKRIKVNRKRAAGDQRLAEGDRVQVFLRDSAPPDPHAVTDDWRRIAKPDLSLVYEDANLLLVDKKAGVLCHSGTRHEYNTLIAHIQASLAEKGEWQPEAENAFAPALCNRIDRNTSGIVIAAKNADALRIVNEKIKSREIDKYYLCVVHGCPRPQTGVLENWLFKDSVKNQVYVRELPCSGARTARTEYRVLASVGPLSLVECHLLTGRTHQIRVQMAHAGWPLLGDGKYGSERLNRRYGETRQALCSYRLCFSFLRGAESLSYLNGKAFTVSQVDFLQRYFPEVDLSRL